MDLPPDLPAAADSLAAVGWDDEWALRFAVHREAGLHPARVLRHDGSALLLATRDGAVQLALSPELEPAPVVGDWVAHDGVTIRAVVERSSLLRRTGARGEGEQPLVANVDTVLVVCGADRPLRPGRFQRFAAIAADAGAEPVLVLAKADLAADPAAASATLLGDHPAAEAVITSARTGEGLDRLRELSTGRTVVAVGESGSGKSTLVNALAGDEVAATAEVRAGDHKGRHTTTARQLHLLPAGGCLIDTPGVRAIGLWVDPEAVSESFGDLDELAAGCRFSDCRHQQEPGCAVRAAVGAGTVAPERLEAWCSLREEAEAAERAVEDARRRSRGRRRR